MTSSEKSASELTTEAHMVLAVLSAPPPGLVEALVLKTGLRADEVSAALDEIGEVLTNFPADLARVLRDPTIIVQRDHEVQMPDGRTLFEHIQEWRNAPSNTASAD